MTPRPVFLTVEQVLAIHKRVVWEFGGDPGLRDRGLLESAVHLPEARFEGKLLHRGVPAPAAAYLFHLCKNHAFLDGNERVALAAAETFLILNGFQLEASDLDVERVVRRVAEGGASKDEVVAFVRKHARSRGS